MSFRDDDVIARLMQRAKSNGAPKPAPAPEPEISTDVAQLDRPRAATPSAEPAAAPRDNPDAKFIATALARRRPRGVADEGLKALPGLGAKLRVPTSFGALPVEALRRRDELRTAKGNFARVAVVDRMTFDADFLIRHEALRPISIRAGSLGRGMPSCDILVSPAQKLSVSKVPQPGSFKTADSLLNLPGVMRSPVELMSYYRFQTEQTNAFLVEGVWILAEA